MNVIFARLVKPVMIPLPGGSKSEDVYKATKDFKMTVHPYGLLVEARGAKAIIPLSAILVMVVEDA